MKKLKNGLGLMLIVLGSVLLVVLHVLHLTFVNALLLMPLAMIVAGAFIMVYRQKRQSKY